MRRAIGGLSVEAFSATHRHGVWHQEDNLRRGHNVRHVIRIRNLRLYTAAIEYEGSIPASPHEVKYSYPELKGENDTDTRWMGQCDLGDKGDDSFARAQLEALVHGGNTNVQTKVIATWPKLAGLMRDEVLLNFNVFT